MWGIPTNMTIWAVQNYKEIIFYGLKSMSNALVYIIKILIRLENSIQVKRAFKGKVAWKRIQVSKILSSDSIQL